MKTTTRRNVASLTFIAVLAAVYAVILLAGRRGDAGNASVGQPLQEKVAPADKVSGRNTVTDSISSDDKGTKHVKSGRSGKRKSRTERLRTAYPDNPDVFDAPVPGIQ